MVDPQPAKNKLQRLFGYVVGAADDVGKILKRPRVQQLQAERRQHRRVARANRALALALGDRVLKHAM